MSITLALCSSKCCSPSESFRQITFPFFFFIPACGLPAFFPCWGWGHDFLSHRGSLGHNGCTGVRQRLRYADLPYPAGGGTSGRLGHQSAVFPLHRRSFPVAAPPPRPCLLASGPPPDFLELPWCAGRLLGSRACSSAVAFPSVWGTAVGAWAARIVRLPSKKCRPA